MSPYKAFLNNTRQYFNTNGFLRFLLSGAVIIFAVGGGLFVLGSFLIGFFNEFLMCIGTVLMLAGLLLTVIKEEVMPLVIISASISFLCLLSWLLTLFGAVGYAGVYNSALGQLDGMFGGDYIHVGGGFVFTTFFYFLAFGGLTALVIVNAEKFKQMRAASAARAQMAGIGCPRCGAFVPMNAAFCPSCGAQNPAMQQYAAQVPVQPQYAPPVQPQYTPPAQPQYAPPVPPADPEAAAVAQCVSCSSFIPAGAAFCSKCGAKQ